MILITGASSGIGEACAREFAKQKKNLFLVARRMERLELLKAELEKAHGIVVHVAQLDVSDKGAVAAWSRAHGDLLKQVSVLVNNAGMAAGMTTIDQGTPEQWDQMIDTNIKGLLYVTHAVLGLMLEKNAGHIVNIGSVAGHHVYPRGNVYCATKHAVKAISESIRVDLVGKNIRMTEISPGMVETEFSVVRLQDEKKAKAVYQGMTPLTAKDIAETVVWCAGRPSHVNVQEVIIYPVDQALPSLVHRR